MRLYVIGFWILLPLVSTAALTWGGRTERRTALLLPTAALASIIVRAHGAGSFRGFEVGLLAVDASLLGCMSLLVVRSRSAWLMWATAFQTIATLSHLGKLTNPHLWRLGYAIMEESSSYPTLIALAVGTWTAWRRGGTWRPSSATVAPPARMRTPPSSSTSSDR